MRTVSARTRAVAPAEASSHLFRRLPVGISTPQAVHEVLHLLLVPLRRVERVQQLRAVLPRREAMLWWCQWHAVLLLQIECGSAIVTSWRRSHLTPHAPSQLHAAVALNLKRTTRPHLFSEQLYGRAHRRGLRPMAHDVELAAAPQHFNTQLLLARRSNRRAQRRSRERSRVIELDGDFAPPSSRAQPRNRVRNVDVSQWNTGRQRRC